MLLGVWIKKSKILACIVPNPYLDLSTNNQMKKEIDKSLHGGAEAFTFQSAKELRLQMTLSEQLMWNELKEKKLGYKFRRQHPYGKYILDFYCHALRLSVEIDGKIHLDNHQRKYDEFRTLELERCNIKELRFSNEEVEKSLDYVISEIRNEIAALTPDP